MKNAMRRWNLNLHLHYTHHTIKKIPNQSAIRNSQKLMSTIMSPPTCCPKLYAGWCRVPSVFRPCSDPTSEVSEGSRVLYDHHWASLIPPKCKFFSQFLRSDTMKTSPRQFHKIRQKFALYETRLNENCGKSARVHHETRNPEKSNSLHDNCLMFKDGFAIITAINHT